ncbi:hypothetical protein DW882_01120 [Faecalibacterium prausnitzii]|nr:hypothetical protein DW882_01120 [Faecalibacterium prausnitzii]
MTSKKGWFIIEKRLFMNQYPSQSKPAALPALPKGEPLVALGQHVLNPGDALPLPLGEVDLRSKDGEGLSFI